ncbi:peptide-methionine (S)-S-oxide reductase MsrA [Halobacillus sp. Marseille-Q1614]|uniref:peptide-methionine (S)-S-oxide reductase MsrA n=1 Tax=Halobacillus sp. Marseille-Q1614 TaxID=2709134 RepID=UPI0015710AF7|nr:peptide-methionine (S)-S-oxide reductase MsrA [Halobacillus sp. Marseille-Q1614]
MATAIFAAGCFWGVEAFFERFEGITKTRVGYTGGHVPHPTYEQVKTGTTGHAESIRIEYDPQVITYGGLVNIFFESHDPTTKDRQGGDVGHQYRSAIFYQNEAEKAIAEEKIQQWTNKGVFKRPIVTEVTPVETFYEAEEYHQKYSQKHSSFACGIS